MAARRSSFLLPPPRPQCLYLCDKSSLRSLALRPLVALLGLLPVPALLGVALLHYCAVACLPNLCVVGILGVALLNLSGLLGVALLNLCALGVLVLVPCLHPWDGDHALARKDFSPRSTIRIRIGAGNLGLDVSLRCFSG